MDLAAEDQTVVQVELTILFSQHLPNLPTKDQDKIYDFIKSLETNCSFKYLPGRNKSSADVPKDDGLWYQKVMFAREHHLWHYHIGVPRYDNANGHGDWTSEYILHYQYIAAERKVIIVAMTGHPPFELPKLNHQKEFEPF